MNTSSARSRVGLIAVITTAAVSMTACSSSSSDTSGADTDKDSTAASVRKVDFDGPSSKFFGSASEPRRVSGTKFVLGFSTAYAAIPGLLAQQKAACDEAVRLGGKCISKDANVSVQNQVSQLNELLTQGATAIAIDPLDPQALKPAFTSAKNAGVPVVAADIPADTSQKPNEQITASVSQALDYSAWATMRAVAEQMPGTTFGILGTASHNPLLQYLLDQQEKYAKAFGLKFAGRVDAQQDNATQWATAATSLAQKYPAMKVVVTYQDPAALAASSAIRATGRTDVKVADANGYSKAAKAAIENGTMVASYAVPWDLKGKAMAIAAYKAQTGQDVQQITAVKGQVVTKDNVGSVETVG